MEKAFGITEGKGFHITFPNGWHLSVQFGGGNYCDNYGARIGTEYYRQAGERGSNTAECAAVNPAGDFVQMPGEGDIVTNRSSATDVLRFLNWVAEQPNVTAAERNGATND